MTQSQVIRCVATALHNITAVRLQHVCECHQAAWLHLEKPSTSPDRSSACQVARQTACLSVVLTIKLEQIGSRLLFFLLRDSEITE